MSIMTCDEYIDFLEDSKNGIESIDRRISYRKIQLFGRNEMGSLSLCRNSMDSGYTPEEEAILRNDEVLNSLRMEKERLQAKINYVTKWGKLPLEYDDALDRIYEDTKEDSE